MKRYGNPPIAGKKYIRRPGAYVILQVGHDQVLLTVQNGEVPDFQLPGGGVDPGEHVIPALHREVLEETGWVIAQPRYLGTYKRYVYMPEYDLWAEKVCAIYTARPCYQRHPPLEPDHMEMILPMGVAVDLLGSDGDRDYLRAFAGV